MAGFGAEPQDKTHKLFRRATILKINKNPSVPTCLLKTPSRSDTTKLMPYAFELLPFFYLQISTSSNMPPNT